MDDTAPVVAPASDGPATIIGLTSSPTMGQVVAALAAAQAEFDTPPKSQIARVRSDKGNYTYRYADLHDVIAAVRPALNRHKIALIQPVEIREGRVFVTTMLAHESGEFLSCTIMMPCGAAPQVIGTIITYCRRYGLTALSGLAADVDDDGEAGTQEVQDAPPPPPPVRKRTDPPKVPPMVPPSGVPEYTPGAAPARESRGVWVREVKRTRTPIMGYVAHLSNDTSAWTDDPAVAKLAHEFSQSKTPVDVVAESFEFQPGSTVQRIIELARVVGGDDA